MSISAAKSERDRQALVKRYQQAERVYIDQIYKLVDAAFVGYTRNLFSPLFLVGINSGERWEELAVMDDMAPPDGWIKVDSRPIPKHMNREQLFAWIKGILGKEPLWIFAGC